MFAVCCLCFLHGTFWLITLVTQSAAEVMRRFKSRLNEVRSKIDEAYDTDERSTGNAWRNLADERSRGSSGSGFFGGVLERERSSQRRDDRDWEDRDREDRDRFEQQRQREELQSSRKEPRERDRQQREESRREQEAPPGEPWNRPTSRGDARLGDWESALRWADQDTKGRGSDDDAMRRRREEERVQQEQRRARDDAQEQRWRAQQQRILEGMEELEAPSRRAREDDENDAIAKEIEEAERRAAAVAAALDAWERRKAAEKVRTQLPDVKKTVCMCKW